jgi:hypothetical protein
MYSRNVFELVMAIEFDFPAKGSELFYETCFYQINGTFVYTCFGLGRVSEADHREMLAMAYLATTEFYEMLSLCTMILEHENTPEWASNNLNQTLAHTYIPQIQTLTAVVLGSARNLWTGVAMKGSKILLTFKWWSKLR